MIDKIRDTDTHFIIDGSTRHVTNTKEIKSMLVQYDHNSERFTFRVPRYVDEHDLSLCNFVRVHFINIDKSKRLERHGIDVITNTVEVCPEDNERVQCSWLITKNATQLAGSLHFVVQFALKDPDNNIIYSWNTAKYTGITIADGINFDEKTVSENNDLLTQWENRLLENQIVQLEQTTFSEEDNGENVWTATFGDGTTQELKVKNGSRGATGYVGSIETIGGKPLHFFVGTKAEYEALTEVQKANLFAIITDDVKFVGNPKHASMVYETLGDIVEESCTTLELFNNTLPENSSVAFTVTSNASVKLTDVPFSGLGFVTLYKGYNANSCYGIAWDMLGYLYHYKYHQGSEAINNGWHKVYTSVDESVPKADTADTAGTAVVAGCVRSGNRMFSTACNGTSGVSVELDSYTLYAISSSDGNTYTLFVGDKTSETTYCSTFSATSSITRAATFLEYQQGNLRMCGRDNALINTEWFDTAVDFKGTFQIMKIAEMRYGED